MVDDATRTASGAIEIADRVWWVGSVRPDDTFQCHAYLIEAGDNSVLIDPGSVLSVDETLRRVSDVVPLSSIHWIVCHHSDPDIAAGLPTCRRLLPAPDLQVVTEWRAETLLRQYDAGIPFFRIEDHDWLMPLDDGRELRFVLTPYLHFPGAMCSYETSTGVVFSSDLFGGFTDGSALFADETYFEQMRPFHEHYMPSREILAAGLGRIQRAFAPINLIAPQHGCIIPQPLVETMFTQLAELECGIFLIAQHDLDVARLMRVTATLRRINDALVTAHDLQTLAQVAGRVLPDVLPMATLELYAHTVDEGLIRFSATDGFLGTPCASVEVTEPSVSLDLPGDGPAAQVVIGLTKAFEMSPEIADMFERLAIPVRVALNRQLTERSSRLEQAAVRDSALHDSLTNLYNRHALDGLAETELPYGVLMIDIDRFKDVNDRFGHPVGDQVLRAVADAVVAAVRADDAVIRYGGEEILVLVRTNDRDLTATIAERIRAGVAALQFRLVDGLDRITVSVGAAMRTAHQPVADAITAADACLYHAKHLGRNLVYTDKGFPE